MLYKNKMLKYNTYEKKYGFFYFGYFNNHLNIQLNSPLQ